MTKRMLIDTTHAEETRVVVMDGERLEDYDVETSTKKQLKGNIYLAKVIRVEPSLQAAFVEYGGNRHGFLAFSEIHPDYFQIPVADREKLLALQDEDTHEEDAPVPEELDAETVTEPAEDHTHHRRTPETVGGEHDTGEESAAARRTARFLRTYKIQEVIRRRQVILVQVVKEERGNKGAALTTYVSLAGRYCVLMPNALRGGGVSRKITSDSDRKRLRDIITSLDLPRGMAMIVRTAGAQRPGPEITRDCEYLLQLWDDIRSHTLSSIAPTLVYEEASLMKRAIRDLFSKDIEDIVIDGEPAWKGAREFMRMLMPHNVNKVKLWRSEERGGQSLFARYQVEGHLDAMYSPTAQLKSGGYLVINQTEALVSIDVNSGRSTSQRNVEETAVRTNLEAADEVARQLRLRDLAGLIVIDFIDMESRRHNGMVEKRLKDALRSDRARIQVGHISHFGLMEMSRQRLRPSITESVLSPCPHCQGTGFVRGTESAALHVLRTVDEEGTKQRAAAIAVHVASSVALYILNHKRTWLDEIESRHRMQVTFEADDSLMPSEVKIDRLRPQTEPAPVHGPAIPHQPIQTQAPDPLPTHTPSRPPAQIQAPVERTAIIEAAPETDIQTEETPVITQENSQDDEGDGRRRRRRRRRGGRRDNQDQGAMFETAPDTRRKPRGENTMPARQSGNSRPTEKRQHAEPTETAALEDIAPGTVAPGRRRTRLRRAVRDQDTQADQIAATAPASHAPDARAHRDRAPRDRHQPTRQQSERQHSDRQHAERHQPERTQRAWVGPTPADPFGGRFDIFDVIAMAEEAHQPEPKSLEQRPPAPKQEALPTPEAAVPTEPASIAAPAETATPATVQHDAPTAEEAPKRRRGRPRKKATAAASSAEASPVASVMEEAEPETPAKRRRTKAETTSDDSETSVPSSRRSRGRPRKAISSAATEGAAESTPADAENIDAPQPVDVDAAPPENPRTGWWRR